MILHPHVLNMNGRKNNRHFILARGCHFTDQLLKTGPSLVYRVSESTKYDRILSQFILVKIVPKSNTKEI